MTVVVAGGPVINIILPLALAVNVAEEEDDGAEDVDEDGAICNTELGVTDMVA